MSDPKDTRSPQEVTWRRFSLRGLLLFVGGCCLLLTLLHFALRSVATTQRASRVNRFARVLNALAIYNDVFHHLPASYTTDANGEPASSWRFVLIHYYDQVSWAISPEPERAWTDPTNAPWLTFPYEHYCPWPNSCMTNVAAVTGQGTAFDLARMCTMGDLPHDTILIIEMDGLNVHWMQPGDLKISELLSSVDLVGVGDRFGTTGDSFIVGFADGQAWALGRNTPFKELKKFLTIDGALQHDRDEVLGPYRLPSSQDSQSGADRN